MVNNATDSDGDPLLYSFDIATNSSFTSNVQQAFHIPEGTGTTSWAPAPLQENTRYYWRVRAFDGQIFGPYMEIASYAEFFIDTINDPPNAPPINSPANNSEVSSITPALKVGNATDPDDSYGEDTPLTYSFEIYGDSEITSLESPVNGVAEGNSYTSWTTPIPLEDNKDYWWRSRSNDGTNAGEWSPAWHFFVNTQNDPPTAPIIDIPINGSLVLSQTPTLIVNASTDIDKDNLSYLFQIYSDALMTTLIASSNWLSQTGAKISWTVTETLNENQEYYWQVKAKDHHGLEGAWMIPSSFIVSVSNEPPSAPTIASPANGSNLDDATPLLVINNSADPEKDTLTYEFQVDNDNAFGSLAASATGVTEGSDSTTSWTVEPELADGLYYWRARTFDGELNSPWTDVYHFNIYTNQSPTITSTPSTEAREGELYSYDVDADDPDGDTLTYSLITSPDGMTIIPVTGMIEWIPGYTQYETSPNVDVSVKVEDERSGTDTQNYTIEVQNVYAPPIVSDIPDISFQCDESYSLSLDDYVTDPDNTKDELTWTADNSNYIDIFIDPATHIAELNSKIPNWGGNTTITFIVSDPVGLKDQTEVDIVVLDFVSPQLTNITSSAYSLLDTSVDVVISWESDEPANSQVEYGISTDYGFLTPIDDTLVTSHSVIITGLNHFTEYKYRVISKDNSGNNSISDNYNIHTIGPYDITVNTDKSVYCSGMPVNIYGLVKQNDTIPVSDCDIKVSVEIHNFRRNSTLAMDVDGTYDYIFNPTENEAGTYLVEVSVDRYGMIRSAQKTFSILGMQIIPNWISVDMGAGTSETRTVDIKNNGDETLTGISIQKDSLNLAEGLSLIVDDGSTATSLQAGEFTSFNVTISASSDVNVHDSFNLVVESDQSCGKSIAFHVTVASTQPIANVSPSSFNVGVHPGDTVQQNINISNIGYGLLNVTNATVDLSWGSVIVPDALEIGHNGNGIINILLFPPSDMAVGTYPGNLIISTSTGDINLSFQIAISQSETADALFKIRNDYDELVSAANIVLTPLFPGGEMESGTTDNQGELLFTNLYIGKYSCEIHAQKHDNWRSVVEIQPGNGTPQQIPIVMFTNALSYEWEVIPADIPEKYFIKLNYTFETDIPKPALVPIPHKINLPFSKQDEMIEGKFTICNGSLIDVNNVRITIPKESMNLDFDLSIDRSFNDLNIDDRTLYTGASIPPKGAITVYYKVTLRDEHPADYDFNHLLWPSILVEGDYIHFNPGTGEPITGQTKLEIPVDVSTSGRLEIIPPYIAILVVRDANIFTSIPGYDLVKIGLDGIRVFAPSDWDTQHISITNRSGFDVDLEENVIGYSLSASFILKFLNIPTSWPLIGEKFDLGTIWQGIVSPTHLSEDQTAQLTVTNTRLVLGLGLDLFGIDMQGGCLVGCYKYEGSSKLRLYCIPISVVSITAAGISITTPVDKHDDDDDEEDDEEDNDWDVIEPVETVHEIVKFEINQEAVVERQGFEASLSMVNMLSTKNITDIAVTVNILEDGETDAINFFDFGITEMSDIDNVEGQGELLPDTLANVTWTLIPKPESGGTSSEGRQYNISASISYKVDGEEFAVETSKRIIKVYPQPQLRLDYFLPKIVTANVPFKLGVMVTNQGPGYVSYFSADSMQPQIVENLSGLLMNMKIIGTCINDVHSENTKLSFEDIYEGESIVGHWLLRSSLSGEITDFDAEWSHSDYQGIAFESLVKEIHVHLIIHDDILVESGESLALIDEYNDGFPDFLMNLDHGGEIEISFVVSAVNKLATEVDPSTCFTVSKGTTEWIYTSIVDALPLFPISKIIRMTDGVEIIENNYWRDIANIYLVDDPDNEYIIEYKPNTMQFASAKGSGWYIKTGNFRNTVMLDVTSDSGKVQSGSYLKYLDGQTRMLLMSTTIDSFSISDNTATLSGDCTVNAAAGYTFEATIEDSNPDVFSISVTGPKEFTYSSTGALAGGDIIVSVDSGGLPSPPEIPDETVALQNYPNPFNPDTWIPFKLSEDNNVSIEIYDLTGRLIRSLQLGYIPAGYYVSKDKAVCWDGKNEVGENVASGVYFYRVSAGRYNSIKKMIILR